jgi:hypothetical protein
MLTPGQAATEAAAKTESWAGASIAYEAPDVMTRFGMAPNATLTESASDVKAKPRKFVRDKTKEYECPRCKYGVFGIFRTASLPTIHGLSPMLIFMANERTKVKFLSGNDPLTVQTAVCQPRPPDPVELVASIVKSEHEPT